MENVDHELISTIINNFFKGKIDDYYSDGYDVALNAYNFANSSYKEQFGDFKNYARSIVNSYLIEYCCQTNIPLKFSENERIFLIDDNLQNDIQLLVNELKTFNISFDKLNISSPKDLNNRNTLLNISSLCLRETFILNYLKKTKKLPIKRLSLFTDRDRSILFKYNDYIIFLMLILIKDNFLSLKLYLNIKVDDNYGT